MRKNVLSVQEEIKVDEHVSKIMKMFGARYKKSDDILETIKGAYEFWTRFGHYEAPKSSKIRKEVRRRLLKKHGIDVFRFCKDIIHIRVPLRALSMR